LFFLSVEFLLNFGRRRRRRGEKKSFIMRRYVSIKPEDSLVCGWLFAQQPPKAAHARQEETEGGLRFGLYSCVLG
jgi:hypothetical protein